MGTRLRRAGATLALLLLLAPLSACELRELVVRIPDFDSAQVEGVWVWRLDDASGQWIRDGQLVFEETLLDNGVEEVHYKNLSEGAPSLDLEADLVRDPANPDTVTLRLYYVRASESGEFRVSTYNQAGESLLTLESTFL